MSEECSQSQRIFRHLEESKTAALPSNAIAASPDSPPSLQLNSQAGRHKNGINCLFLWSLCHLSAMFTVLCILFITSSGYHILWAPYPIVIAFSPGLYRQSSGEKPVTRDTEVYHCKEEKTRLGLFQGALVIPGRVPLIPLHMPVIMPSTPRKRRRPQ